MKRISKWLESKIWRKPAAVGADGRHTPVRVTTTGHTPVGVTTKENVKEENSDSDRTPTVPALTILEESSFEIIESTGYDPYNSGSFETSKLRSYK